MGAPRACPGPPLVLTVARARSFAEVYDAKAFRSEHPGGPMFISVFGGR